MGHGGVPPDKESQATILCIENGGNLFRPTTKDGSFAGPADEGALHHPLLYRQLSPYLPEAYIGGWLLDSQDPARHSVYGFHVQIHQSQFPRAFKDGNPKKRIAALELLGTLVLTHCVLKLQGKTASAVKIPVGSDNQSSVFSLLNQASKKPHTAAILTELVLLLHAAGCTLAPCHVP